MFIWVMFSFIYLINFFMYKSYSPGLSCRSWYVVPFTDKGPAIFSRDLMYFTLWFDAETSMSYRKLTYFQIYLFSIPFIKY